MQQKTGASRRKRRAAKRHHPSAPSPKAKSERRQPHWLVPIIIGALACALVAGVVTHHVVVSAAHGVVRFFKGAPSLEDRRISAWVNQATTAAPWASPPTVFTKSESALRSNYRAFDPNGSKVVNVSPQVDMGLLVEDAPEFNGALVRFAGRILDEHVIASGSPFSGFHVWQFELNDPRASKTADDGARVYCSMTLPAVYPVEPPNSLVALSGIAIAEGTTRSNRLAVYAICNGIAQIVILSPHHKPTSFGTP